MLKISAKSICNFSSFDYNSSTCSSRNQIVHRIPQIYQSIKNSENMIQKQKKNFRKRCIEQVDYINYPNDEEEEVEEEEEERRLALEEVKLLQKQRERKSGIPAFINTTASNSNASASALQSGGGGLVKLNGGSDKNNDGDGGGGGGGGGEKEELVLQDTFAQETAVMVEDPNMLKYVEQELAKKRGKNIDAANQAENDLTRADDELYKIPEHLKVKRRNSEESSTQWTTGIAEIQLPIEFKLKNIEETEAAKKLLQVKRLTGRTKTESSIPSSYSADYFQRGRDHAEKLRKENTEQRKDKGAKAADGGGGSKPTDGSNDAAGRREAASDQFMLERFRKRERHRVMHR